MQPAQSTPSIQTPTPASSVAAPRPLTAEELRAVAGGPFIMNS